MGLAESPLFAKLEEKHEERACLIMEVLRFHKKRVLLALGSRIGSDIAFYVFTLFLLVYLPTHLHMSKSVRVQRRPLRRRRAVHLRSRSSATCATSSAGAR